MPQAAKPVHQPLLSPTTVGLRATTAEAHTHRAHAPHREKPLQREAHALQLDSNLPSTHLETACAQQQTPSTAPLPIL